MDIADYYRQLGLRSGASLSQVKASYRQLARQYHPDVNPGNEQAKNKFIAITEAYKFLVNIAPPMLRSRKLAIPLCRLLRHPGSGGESSTAGS
jgi:curved DNA-binding protein CbpA